MNRNGFLGGWAVMGGQRRAALASLRFLLPLVLLCVLSAASFAQSCNIYPESSDPRYGFYSLAFTSTSGSVPSPATFAALSSGTSLGCPTNGISIAPAIPAGVTWITVTPGSATAPLGVTGSSMALSVNPSGLSAGTHSAVVTFRSLTSGITANGPGLTVSLTVVPPPSTLTILPAPLTFTMTAGGPLPPSQNVTFTSSSGTISWADYNSLPLNIAYLSPSSGSVIQGSPTSVSVSVNPVVLGYAVGSYSGAVWVNYGPTFSQIAMFNVTVNVVAQTTGTLGVSPSSLSFTAPEGQVPPPQNVTITSSSGTLSWNAATQLTSSAPANWISASPAGGSASPGSPGTTTVSILPIVTTFPSGTYTANVNVTSGTGPGAQLKTLAVTYNSTPASVLVISQTRMVFAALVNAPGPPSQSLPINTSAGNVSFSTLITYPQQTPNWLSVSPSSSAAAPLSAPTTLTVSVQLGAITQPGLYAASINFTASGNPLPVTVYLEVKQVPDNIYTFNSQIGGAPPAPLAVPITNSATVSVLAGAASDQSNWLALSPPNTGVTPTSFTLTASPGSLPAGQYEGILAVTGVYTDQTGTVYGFFEADLIALNIAPVVTQTVQTVSHIADGQGWSTSIILVNTGAQPAPYTLQVTGDNGAAIANSPSGLGMLSTAGTIPVGGSKTISTDGTAANLSGGWARVTSSQSIGGTAIFRAAQPKGSIVPYQEAAVPLLTTGNSTLLFPFDDNGSLATGVALAAPDNSTMTTVSWRQRNQAGQNLTSSPEPPMTVPPFGHAVTVMPVDSALAANLRGVAQFDTQNGNVFGLGIRLNSATGAFTSVEAVTNQQPATKIISHVADGGLWKTTIILVNTDTAPATFTVNLWQDNGNPFAVQLVGSSAQSSITGVIPVGGTYTIETADVASLTTTGWAEVLSSQSIGGTAIFRDESRGQEAAVPLLTAGGTKLMMPFDIGSGFALGVALANPSLTQDANITYTVRDENGNPIPNNPPVSLSLPRHQHAVIGLSLNLNGAAEQRGVVEFDSPNGAVFVLGVRFNNGAFTSERALGK